MKVITDRDDLRNVLAAGRLNGRTVGLVPTMGSFHEGHLALMSAARESTDLVVVSLFVNPTQFGEREDLDSYPADLSRDRGLAEAAGVDVLWTPSREDMYPPGFSTWVEVDGLTDVLCGSPERRGSAHFRGVTTVVTKLFNTVRPDVAFFGQKDAQQALVLRRMAADLDMGVEVRIEPTVRAADGLALSSRNAHLSDAERIRATCLSRIISAASGQIRSGGANSASILEKARSELVPGVELEYLEIRNAEDLSAVENFNGRPVLVAIAARVGKARLIDNTIVQPTPSGG